MSSDDRLGDEQTLDPAERSASTLDSGSPGDETASSIGEATGHAPTLPAQQPGDGWALDDTGPVPAFPPNRFEIIGLLGHGSDGDVYKAWDARLRRHVALKLLRSDKPEETALLVAEAQAQARVEHEHVRKVYGVGDLDGQPFIAMQYVEGETFHELGGVMSLEERVRIVLQVAEGLHAAHRIGLIHRDVKPSNILIERVEGGYKPYVTDFGAAHDVSHQADGFVVGTPQYMAPEQARGESRLDRRTDVYGLGATLYDACTGQPPFPEGSVEEVMRKVREVEPRRLRQLDASLPVSLERIVRRCLSKAPEQRYETARELALDLQRFLDGEPVSAGGHPRLRQLGRRLRRHAPLLAVGSLALGFAGMALQARRAASEQARQAQLFGQKVEQFELVMRQAAMAPLHDARKEREAVEREVRQIAGTLPRLSSAQEGPARYAVGRGWLVLGNQEAALAELQRAYDDGYRPADLEHSLGRALGETYMAKLRQARQLEEPAQQAAKQEELARQYREPARRLLQKGEGSLLEPVEYLEALIAYYEGRYDDALSRADKARQRVPWLFESLRLAGDVHVARGDERWSKGDGKAALREYDSAGHAYQAATAIAHSDSASYDGDCQRMVSTLAVELASGAAPEIVEKRRTEGSAACELALRVDPDNGNALASQAQLNYLVGRYFDAHGDTRAEPLMTRALQLAERACERAPQLLRAHLMLSQIALDAGLAVYDQGHEPRPFFDRAIKAARRAVEIAPASAEPQAALSSALLRLASCETERGFDGSRLAREAVVAAERGVKLGPGLASAHRALAFAHLYVGHQQISDGRDGRAELERAGASYERSIELNPGLQASFSNLCLTNNELAEQMAMMGQDARPILARALPACERALSMNPRNHLTHESVANYRWVAALDLIERGEDPTAAVQAGRATLEAAMKVNPRHPYFYLWSGLISTIQARWEMLRPGGNPEPSFALATEALRRGSELNDSEPDIARAIIELERLHAEWEIQNDRSPEAAIARGLVAADRALQSNPRDAPSLGLRAQLRFLAARTAPVAERQARMKRAEAEVFEAYKENALLKRQGTTTMVRLKALVAAHPAR